MKVASMIIISSLSLLMTTSALAGCGDESGCGGDNYCNETESPCACVDRGWTWNTCMTKADFCRNFGNIGAMED